MNELELLRRAYPAPPDPAVAAAKQRVAARFRNPRRALSGRRRGRVQRRQALVAVLVLAAISLAVAPYVGNDGPRAAADSGYPLGQPAANAKMLNEAFMGCLNSHGTTTTLIPDSQPKWWAVNIPHRAYLACDSLDVAREAAGDGYGVAASRLASIGPASEGFWRCVSHAGYDIGGFPQPDPNGWEAHAYGSAAFAYAVTKCGAAARMTLNLGV